MTKYDNMNKELPARMSCKEAAIVLRKYNEYRRGYLQRSDPPYSAKVIGEAIDVAIVALEPSIVPTLENIIQAVSRETGVTDEEMMMRCRCREYAYARYMVFWLAYNYTRATQTSMARRFCLKDHVSVSYGIKKGDEWMSKPKLNEEWHKTAQRIIKSFSTDDKNH